MAQTAAAGVVPATEVGHRVANDRLSRNGAYPMPPAPTSAGFSDAHYRQVVAAAQGLRLRRLEDAVNLLIPRVTGRRESDIAGRPLRVSAN
jgi:hypothetical protein